VIELDKSNESFRMLYDTKGRFVLQTLSPEEAKFKLLKIVGEGTQSKGVPYVVSHDGRTLRYPDPLIKKNDTVKLDLATGKVRRRRYLAFVLHLGTNRSPFAHPTSLSLLQITEIIKFEVGNVVTVTKGRNTGRIGTVTSVDRYPGSFDIATIKDASGAVFATRLSNVFTLGKTAPSVSIPKGKGVKLSIFEQRDRGSNVQ